MDENKTASGRWEWLKSDTVEMITNIAIYGAAVGGIAMLEQVKALNIENQMVASFVGLACGYAIDALRRWSKDNNANV
ncbi:hypothetical protein [Gimesia fumaroli]|uniref:Uncharacterized protein n=1 Tax=Gimesia fumaroli TaxID=2527976 RepID=A0A518I8X6_9PLAN|nr:hypothetical protein [Gimesia fumaroli]QDV49566.1 hypothetical protein Enr17x_15860 [Gimesia fumaroli]